VADNTYVDLYFFASRICLQRVLRLGPCIFRTTVTEYSKGIANTGYHLRQYCYKWFD